MTKDFKKQAASDSAFSQYGMGWMLGGIAVGLLVGLGLYAMNNDKLVKAGATTAPGTAVTPAIGSTPGDTHTIPNQANNIAQHDTVSPEPEADKSPGFSYHAVLPQLEVSVPVVAPDSSAVVANKGIKPSTDSTMPATTANTAKLGKINGFQLGSYKTEAQAISLQARVRANGLNSRVEKAEVNGVPMFRVRIGPATNQAMLDKWEKTLIGMGITPMGVRM